MNGKGGEQNMFQRSGEECCASDRGTGGYCAGCWWGAGWDSDLKKKGLRLDQVINPDMALDGILT